MADEAAVERVKRAIETILSDSASPSQRQSAHQVNSFCNGDDKLASLSVCQDEEIDGKQKMICV